MYAPELFNEKADHAVTRDNVSQNAEKSKKFEEIDYYLSSEIIKVVLTYSSGLVAYVKYLTN